MLLDKQKNRLLTTEKIIDFYYNKGEEITRENAEKVVNLLYFLAKLVVKHYLKE